MIDGAGRYAAWAKATGNDGGQYVKAAATFLRDDAWQERWELRDPGEERVNLSEVDW